jgi:hypothetical protein
MTSGFTVYDLTRFIVDAKAETLPFRNKKRNECHKPVRLAASLL